MFALHTDDVIPYCEDEAQCLLHLVRRGCRRGRDCVRTEKRTERDDADRLYYLTPSRRRALVSRTVQGHHVGRRERKGVG